MDSNKYNFPFVLPLEVSKPTLTSNDKLGWPFYGIKRKMSEL